MTEPVVLDTNLLQTITIVEEVTQARIDKCIPKEDKLVFVVEQGGARKIVGPEGKMLKQLESKLGKRLKVIEKTPEKFQFIKNAFLPLRISEIKEEDGIVSIHGEDEKTRGLMIGAKAHNLRFLEKIVQMYFPDVKEIKVY
jgi:N utilization substance protein A